jgi:succinoglycan biosynthesis protein ExoM
MEDEAIPNTLLEISVCICTYKRSELLVQLLESLSKQTIAPERFEIVVVDNDKAATARQTVIQTAQRYPMLSIRYAIEARPGISYARNKTVSLAIGKYLAFIDDDEWAASHWLPDLFACIEASDADAVLGPVLPQVPAGSHEWAIKSGFFDRPRFITGTEIGCDTCRTGNALVRADRIKARKPQPFDERLALSGGEDHDFFKWCASNGGNFIWCDTALVNEAVPLERQSLNFILERCFRTSTRYWRDEYSGHSTMWALCKALTGLVGGAFLVLLGLLAIPLGLSQSVRVWRRGINGLGRVAALKNTDLIGYGDRP